MFRIVRKVNSSLVSYIFMLSTYFTSYCHFSTFGSMERTYVTYVSGNVCESFYTVSFTFLNAARSS